MAKDLAIIVVHGMGDTSPDFDLRLRQRMQGRMGEALWSRIAWHPVYYQKILQEHQRRLMRDCIEQADIDWLRLRRFVLYGFSDAAAMEARPHVVGSVYQQVQRIVLDSLDAALQNLGDARKPVLLIAHSLGGQVMSNFIWDAQQSRVSAGVFRADLPDPIGKSSGPDKFRRLKTLRYFFTSGCNIPIFIAGIPKSQIRPIIVNARGWRIRWENYYDPDDALGWPLHPLSPSYKAAVAVDEAINVGGPMSGWTPMSHTAYWKDADFLDPLEAAIRSIL